MTGPRDACRRPRAHRVLTLLVCMIATSGLGCWGSDDVPDAPPAPAASAQANKPDIGNPLEYFVQKAGQYIVSNQEFDGSWAQFRSTTPEFASQEPQSSLRGTLMVIGNLAGTEFAASSAVQKAGDYVKGLATERNTWAEPLLGQPAAGPWVEPNLNDTALALTVLGSQLTLEPSDIEKVKTLLDEHRDASGLYLAYLDGFFGANGVVPEANEASIGVNFNVLGFLGKHGLDSRPLIEALDAALDQPRYWEVGPYYTSLPTLALLASNAVESGALEGRALLVKVLNDFSAHGGNDLAHAPELDNFQLAAAIKARSHLCLIDRTPCRDLDLWVFELSKRRHLNGSWPTAPSYTYTGTITMRAAIPDTAAQGADGRAAVPTAAGPITATLYVGSPSETTSVAMRALFLYRDLVRKRINY